MVQLGPNAAWPEHLLACGRQVQRKQVGMGHRGAGLDWTSYNLLACRTDVSSGRTEAGMRRLKPSTVMTSQSRGGAAHIISAWHPCWSSRNSAAATMRRCAATAKTLASSDCGCTSFLRRRAAAGWYCDSLPEYLQSSCPIQLCDAATMPLIFVILSGACLALKKNWSDFMSTGTHRRGDPARRQV